MAYWLREFTDNVFESTDYVFKFTDCYVFEFTDYVSDFTDYVFHFTAALEVPFYVKASPRIGITRESYLPRAKNALYLFTHLLTRGEGQGCKTRNKKATALTPFIMASGFSVVY